MAPTPPGGATRRQGNADLWPVLPVGAGTARRRRAAGRTPSWSRPATAWCHAATAWSQRQQTPLQRGVTRLQRGVAPLQRGVRASRPRSSVVSRGYSVESAPADPATAWCRAATRISHTHGPKRTPGNRNLLTRKTVTREARIPTDLTACRMGDTDFQLVAVKEQVSQVRHHARWRRRSGNADLRSAQRPAGGSLPSAFTGRRHGAHSAANGVCHSNVRITPNAGIPAEKEPPRNWGSFPPPAFGGLCRPEVGVPLPARRSAWWHGRHAPVQRPRGAFCDSASAPEYESGLQRGVSASRPRYSVVSPGFSVESRGKSAGRDRWWAMQDLNLRLLPCEGSTLPLS